MERRKRDRYDIILDILETCVRGCKKTELIYRANLSFELAQKYLELLMNSGLLSFESTDRIYSLTKKGEETRKLLLEYRHVKKIYHDIRSRLNML